MIYFQEEQDGSIYFGHSDQPAKRSKTHANAGKRLVAARPGTGKGRGTDEDRIHTFFQGDRIPERGSSTYGGDRIWGYVEWLLTRGYAVPTLQDAERLPGLPYEVWRPEKSGDAFTEDSGEFQPTGVLIETRNPKADAS
jgi:hypothetical protein